MVEAAQLRVRTLGLGRIESPLSALTGRRGTTEHYVDEGDRVLFDDTLAMLAARNGAEPPSFEPGGPRRRIFFDPSKIRVGIVTCGGLCPGLNDVIRGLVLELTSHYGVTRIVGFRNGYRGLVARHGHDVVELTPARVEYINEQGGTVLGTSRGNQDPEEIVDCLDQLGINILFVVGGDGSMRGAERIARRDRGPRPADRGGRRAEDHRQRHPVHRAQLRLPDRVRQGDRVDPGRAHRGDRACPAASAWCS